MNNITFHYIVDKLTILCVLALMMSPLTSLAAETSFSWLPNSEQNLAGYKIHYGRAQGNYTFVIDVGNPELKEGHVEATLTGLEDDTTYYAVATAYDQNDAESPYSSEVSWTTPAAEEQNTAPSANNASLSTQENTEISGQLTATDADGDTLSFAITANPTKGAVSVTPSGSFTYTPDTYASGTDTFSFKANDGLADSQPAKVTITILDANPQGSIEVTKIFGKTPDSDVPNTLKDTYTNINETIYDEADVLITYSWSRPSPNKVSNTIIIKVDLSSLPADASIEEAKLALYQISANGQESYQNSVHKIINKNPSISQTTGKRCSASTLWSPAPGKTFNNIPLGLADIQASEDTLVLTSRNGYKEWTITNMVRDWLNNPAANYGLLIKGAETSSSTGRQFASTENNNAAIRPKIIIKYRRGTPPVPRILSIQQKNH